MSPDPNLYNGVSSYFFVLQSVNTNTGMQLKFTYPTQVNLENTIDSPVYYVGNFGTWNAPDDLTYSVAAIDGAQEYCSKTATSCALTKSWQSVSFSTARNTAGTGATVITSTDALGNARQFNLSLAPFSDPAWASTPQVLNSITSPGGMDNVTIQRTFYNAPTTIIRNGTTTSYSWQNRPNSTLCNQWGCPITQYSTQQVAVSKGGVIASQFNTAGNIPSLSVGLSYMTSIVDGIGNATNYTKGCEGIPGSITNPQGNQTNFTFDSRCNIVTKTEIPKPGSSLANIVTLSGYDATCSMPAKCNKPNWVKDAKGNQTDFTYTSWGAIASELRPAPTAGAARPLKLYTYQQISANVLSAAGVLVSTGQPIWMPATETQCQTNAGSSALNCDSAAPQVTTTYLYGAANAADNLFMHGKQVTGGGITLTTCFSYDQWGRIASETAPNANLTTCP